MRLSHIPYRGAGPPSGSKHPFVRRALKKGLLKDQRANGFTFMDASLTHSSSRQTQHGSDTRKMRKNQGPAVPLASATAYFICVAVIVVDLGQDDGII